MLVLAADVLNLGVDVLNLGVNGLIFGVDVQAMTPGDAVFGLRRLAARGGRAQLSTNGTHRGTISR